MRRIGFVMLTLLAVTSPAIARAQSSGAADAPKVLVVKVDGSIDRTVASYLRESLDAAEADGSTVIVQLDTAGTLDQDAVALAQRIHDATVPVIVWVGPSPAKAAGAGVLFMYASSEAVVAPGAGIGPLEPLDLTRPESEGIATSAIANLVSGWAHDFGKPNPLAFPAAPLPAQAVIDRHIAQFAAASIPDLLDKLDGTMAPTTGGDVILHTKVARSASETPVDVRFTGLGPVDRVLHAMASPAGDHWASVIERDAEVSIATEFPDAPSQEARRSESRLPSLNVRVREKRIARLSGDQPSATLSLVPTATDSVSRRSADTTTRSCP